MAIRIARNEQGNCINFYGSSNPTYWNACLSGQVDSTDTNTVNVINDIITAQTGVTQYEFFRVPYTDFTDVDGNGFASAQEAADYITAQANVVGLGGGGTDLNGQTVCFQLDDTSTSIMLDNGYSFGVNTIKAVSEGGDISIKSELGEITHFTGLQVGNVCGNDGNIVTGGLTDIINYLNELFTVGAFESVIITDPEATTIADVGGVNTTYNLVGSTAIDPIGDGIFTNSGSGNYAGLKSVDTIDQVGEYFTFDIQGEGQLGFGLIHTDASYAAGLYNGNASYADPSTFAISNSAHYGFQFSHWFHPTPNGSWTNYGANTSVSYGPHWSANWDKKQDWLDGQAVKVRVGLDVNGFISIETLNDDGTWGVHARTTYPQLEGAEFHLGIKIANASSSIVSIPKVHLLAETAPTMYFRYIESPDGVFQYPLFASTEEAEYYDEQAGGSGTYHTHVFEDDPTNTTWYMPTTNAVHNGTSAPAADLTLGQPASYTEITSVTNADLTPAAFSDNTITVDELSAVNIQLHPQGAYYTTSIVDTDSSGLTIDANGIHLNGTAPEVLQDNVTNPSDTYSIEVVRTNSYGSASGTLTLVVNNLTAPVVTPITGVTDEGGTALIDSDTMADGSVVSIDEQVQVDQRFVIEKEWVDTYVLPKITSGTGAKSVFIGFPDASADWSSPSTADFSIGYQFYSDDTVRSQNNWRLRTIAGGTVSNNIGVGGQTSGLYDYVFVNDGTDINFGSLVESQGLDASSYVYNTSGVDSTWKYTGGLSGVTSQARDIVIATSGTDMDLDLQYFAEYTEPTPPVANLTPWTKALDFSGGSEYALKVSTFSGANPLLMDSISQVLAGPSTVGNTSNASNARPWATVIVFRPDGNSSNQHIWNSGEGAGSNDDNIYLRLDASGNLYFGWGRQGALNECVIGAGFNGSSGTSQYWGVYIAHNGTRLSGSNATASNLAAAFDIRIMNYNGGAWNFAGVSGTFADSVGNRSTVTNWSRSGSSTGGRMDRAFIGNFTIGGRGANRNFHGKVASMVITTLRLGVAMPTDAEIELMITDPRKWEDDYRVGQTVRRSQGASDVTYASSSLYNGHGGTQIWLMGDSYIDSYANGIRNDVYHGDQNYGKLQLNSMVSNDIENVSILGLS